MTTDQKKQYEESEKAIREIAWLAWKGAANAHRMYPDNSHTFSGYWSGAKDLFQKYIDAHNFQQSVIDQKEREAYNIALDDLHMAIDRIGLLDFSSQKNIEFYEELKNLRK